LRASAVRRTASLAAAAADPAIRAVIQRSAELDALHIEMADAIGAPAPDLVAVYLPGLDIAQHTLLGTVDGAQSASALAARVDAVREYYVFLDGLLRKTLTPGAGEIVFLLTGPGRVSVPGPGVLALSGPASRGSARVDGGAADVTPTILYALGLPHSRELAGRPLRELFDPAYASKYPVREIATYGPPSAPSAPRSGRPLDEEMLERLRSLGYVR